MPTSVRKKTKKKRGRPATGRDPVTAIRLPEDLRVRVEAWAAKLGDAPSRSEAIRRLIEIGLAGMRTAKPSNKKSAAKAAGMAGEMVDYLSDQSAPADVREKRKRRLLTGPSEFRDMRTDLPTTKAG
jgi:Arc/MetJ-type ribon-helix-helix transcriptional regulator